MVLVLDLNQLFQTSVMSQPELLVELNWTANQELWVLWSSANSEKVVFVCFTVHLCSQLLSGPNANCKVQIPLLVLMVNWP